MSITSRNSQGLFRNPVWKTLTAVSMVVFLQTSYADEISDQEDLEQELLVQESDEDDHDIAEEFQKATFLGMQEEINNTSTKNEEIGLNKTNDNEISQQEPSKTFRNSKLQIGANYTYLTLKPHGHETFGGSLGGIQTSYEYQPMNNLYAGLLFAWRDGKVHSDAGKRSVLYFDVQERFGYTYSPKSTNWLVTLFSGFAYRYLGENFTPKDHSSLDFGYNEFYFPVGFLTCYKMQSWFSFGLDFTWMPQVFSTVSIVPLKGARWNLTNRLDNFLVEIPLNFALSQSRKFFLIIKPTYQHWEDGHSTARLPSGLALGLPGNSYNYYGFDINFEFCF